VVLKLREWMEKGVPEYGLLSIAQVRRRKTHDHLFVVLSLSLSRARLGKLIRFDIKSGRTKPFPYLSSDCSRSPMQVHEHEETARVLKAERDELAKRLESVRKTLVF
jgi:predicted SprT family Zn-dependent metalloprotease